MSSLRGSSALRLASLLLIASRLSLSPSLRDAGLSKVGNMTAPYFQSSDSEPAFQKWYAERASKLHINPNPDDPRHFYDYRAAYRAGAEPDSTGHWPSKFKLPGHPRLIINGVDTRTGDPPPQHSYSGADR